MNGSENKKYSLFVTNESFSAEGVLNVKEYTDKTAVLKINGGIVQIEGNNINLLTLDTEKNTAKFSGTVLCVKISDKYVKPGVWGKLFK